MTLMKKFKKLFNKNNYVDSQVIYKNSTSKYSMTAECTLELSCCTDEKKKEINAHLQQLVKKYIESPEKLIQYMQLKGATVYKIDNASKVLSFLGEEEGFVSPLTGMKAIALSAILSIITEGKLKISFSTKEMLIFNTNNTEIYTIARALHKYYGFKNNLPGFDAKSQAVFKKIYGRKNSKSAARQLENVPLKDIFACRDALVRDLESINFTLQLSLEHERSKKALNKILTERNAKI